MRTLDDYVQDFPEGEFVELAKTLNAEFQAAYIKMARQVEAGLKAAATISHEAYEFTLMAFVTLHPSQYHLMQELLERRYIRKEVTPPLQSPPHNSYPSA